MFELPENATKFLEEIAELSNEYGLSLAHEDDHGSFIVDDYKDENVRWLKGAFRRYSKHYEIWLDDHYMQFARGISHCTDGTDRDLVGFYNSSTYGADSVHVEEKQEDPEDYGNNSLRWHARMGCIEFHFWPQEIQTVTFHNGSSRGIYLYGFNYLPAGESTTITRGKKVHKDLFKGCTPLCLVDWKEAPDRPDLTGKRGLLLEGLCKENHAKFFWRFISIEQLMQGADAVVDLETPVGIRIFEENGRRLQTDNGEYAFTFMEGGA